MYIYLFIYLFMYLYLFIKSVHMERIHQMKFNPIVSSKDYAQWTLVQCVPL